MPAQLRELDRRALKGRLRNDRGAALVEFALVLPLLMVLLLGLVDFGKAFTMWIDETHIANTAARYAAVNSWTDSSGTKRSVDSDVVTFQDTMEDDGDTQQLRDSFDEPGHGVRVCLPSGSNGVKGDPIQVDVTASYTFLAYISGFVRGDFSTKTLSAHSTMRIENPYSAAFVADPANRC